jgi:conjugative transfer region protein (TIGR03750 family)
MPGSNEARAGTTVTFLPHRLNRQPVIVRGLTANELWITVGLSAACGLVPGIVLATVMRSIAMAPTLVVLCVAAGVFFGGGVLRRHKRGRPDTWLYRQMQWRLCQRFPALSASVGSSGLITRSGYWTTRRVTPL